MKYSLVDDGDVASITVYVDGEVLTSTSDHPNFKEIVEKVTAGTLLPSESYLFDPQAAASAKFQRVSERVTVANGHVYFDGDEQSGALVDQIIRFMDEGNDFKPLVLFMEKIAQNPTQHSREQAYTWLEKNRFTIDEDGDIVAYKGVNAKGDGLYTSTHAGPAIVNGESVTGYVEQRVGDIVEMPRSQVTHDPNNACSSGLHVSGWAYAQSYGQARLQVKVNPRDIVSVPTHDNFAKVRCCRYTIVGVVTKPVGTALLAKPVAKPEQPKPVIKTPKPVAPPITVPKVKPVKYADMTLRELRKMAQDRKVRGVYGQRPSHCHKQELVVALQRQDRKDRRKASKPPTI